MEVFMQKFRYHLMLSAAVLAAVISLQAGTTVSDSTCMTDSSCKKSKMTRSYVVIQAGIATFDPDKLNNTLSLSGLTGFDPLTFSSAIGGHREYRRLITEGLFSTAFWRKNDNNAIRTTLASINLSSNTGVNLLPPDFNLNLFPYAGLGVGINKLQVHQKSASFNEVLTTAIPDRVLRQGTITFNAGLGSDYTLPSDNKKCGFVVGVRGGYQLPLYTSKWRSDGTTISEFPDLKQQGFYVGIVIGGWNNNDKKDCGKEGCEEKQCRMKS
jgi:hypothetical protein